jgi:thiol-disulfide isomerase/thioredoxin
MAFLLATALVGCSRGSAKTNEAEAPSASSVAVMQPDSVVVYYFHGARRCPTCRGIQETIERTIKERFGAETASAALSFQDVNIDEPDNKHFAKEYNLSFSSMVVSARKGKETLKWENCDKVWEHARDPSALADYTDRQIRGYLEMLKRN